MSFKYICTLPIKLNMTRKITTEKLNKADKICKNNICSKCKYLIKKEVKNEH